MQIALRTSPEKKPPQKRASDTEFEENWPIVTLPYIKGTTEKITRMLRNKK